MWKTGPSIKGRPAKIGIDGANLLQLTCAMCKAGLRTKGLLQGGSDWHIEPMRFAPPPASLTAPAIHSSSRDRLHRIGGTPPPSRRSQFEKPAAPPPAAGFSVSGCRLGLAGAAIGSLNSVQPADVAAGRARTCKGCCDLHHERLAEPADGVAMELVRSQGPSR